MYKDTENGRSWVDGQAGMGAAEGLVFAAIARPQAALISRLGSPLLPFLPSAFSCIPRDQSHMSLC